MAKRAQKPPREAKEPKWQTHVYLCEADYMALKVIAERDSRSVTMQLQHFIRQGIAAAKSK